jgi:hypothetical protein
VIVLFSGLESADFVNKILYESSFLVALHKVEFSVDDDNESEKMRLLSSALKRCENHSGRCN